ncbi:MAG: phosphatidate cytidylyltransferase [Puniceicoccales bacterium]|nr:phosphatidate cytidylyltransferase [Puniceicoccales bacterium]
MKARIFSTITLWLTISLVLYFGKIWGGLALLILVTGAAHWEFCTLLAKCGGKPRQVLSVALGAIIIAGVCWSVLDPELPINSTGATLNGFRPSVVIPGMAIGLISLLLLRNTDKLVALYKTAPTVLSWLYIPCSMAPLAYLAAEYWANGQNISGLLLVVWVIATVKFTDCGALIFGLTFGKHKLAPSISPGKSWEGCVGGVATSVGVGAGIAWLYTRYAGSLEWTILSFTPGKAALIALPLAILSVPSDLIESVFKRRAGVKDSGKTIPGIGGAFDLLDSLILTAPVGYLLLRLFA